VKSRWESDVARIVRNSKIDSRSRRLGLAARGEPYWQTLQRGLAIGYYRPAKGGAGTWWGRVRIGRCYTVEALATADDHTDADGEHVLDWRRAQAAVRSWGERQTGLGPLTVADVVRDYLDDLRARKGERAATREAGRLEKHLLLALGDRRVADLSPGDLLAWRNGMVPTNGADEERVRRSRDTANRILHTVKAALNHSFRSGQIANDTAWRRLEPFKGAGAARKIILDPLQIQRLLDACSPGLHELVAVAAQTGARLGELTSAKVHHFDPDAGTLRVDGKTGPREIYLAPATILLLRRTASGRPPNAPLLAPSERATWTENLHRRRFAAAVRKAGLDPATCVYSLRHSYISHALKRLVPVKAVADHCGTSMAMIERHYAKFIVADRRRYAELGCPDLRLDGTGAEIVHIGAAR
jgi:integrase